MNEFPEDKYSFYLFPAKYLELGSKNIACQAVLNYAKNSCLNDENVSTSPYFFSYYINQSIKQLGDGKIYLEKGSSCSFGITNIYYNNKTNDSYVAVFQRNAEEKNMENFKRSKFASVIEIERSENNECRITSITKHGTIQNLKQKKFQISKLLDIFQLVMSDPPQRKDVDHSIFSHPKKFDRIFREGNDENINYLIENIVLKIQCNSFPSTTLPVRMVCEIKELLPEDRSSRDYNLYVKHLMANPDYLKQMTYDFVNKELFISKYEKSLISDLKARILKESMEEIISEDNSIMKQRRSAF